MVKVSIFSKGHIDNFYLVSSFANISVNLKLFPNRSLTRKPHSKLTHQIIVMSKRTSVFLNTLL